MWIKRKRNPQSVQNLEISPFLLKQYRLKCGKNMPKKRFFFLTFMAILRRNVTSTS